MLIASFLSFNLRAFSINSLCIRVFWYCSFLKKKKIHIIVLFAIKMKTLTSSGLWDRVNILKKERSNFLFFWVKLKKRGIQKNMWENSTSISIHIHAYNSLKIYSNSAGLKCPRTEEPLFKVHCCINSIFHIDTHQFKHNKKCPQSVSSPPKCLPRRMSKT